MKRWSDRPVEIQNLFNPAFCGVVLFRALAGFEEEDPRGMPFSLSLLILPLSLQKTSREVLSNSTRSYLLKAVEKNPHILIGFGERAQTLLPFTFEALGLLMQMKCFDVSGSGRIKTIHSVRKSVTGTAESKACQRVARFVGKEFARISDRVTIYTSLGIRP